MAAPGQRAPKVTMKLMWLCVPVVVGGAAVNTAQERTVTAEAAFPQVDLHNNHMIQAYPQLI